MRRAVMKTAKRADGFFTVFIILAVALAAELIMSNFVWLAYVAVNDGAVDCVPVQEEFFEVTEENRLVHYDCEPLGLNSVSFTVQAFDAESKDFYATAECFIFDENNLATAAMARSELIAVGAQARRVKLYLNALGSCNGVSLEFRDFPQGFAVSDVVINEQYDFEFNMLRFALVFVALSVIFILKSRAGRQLRDEMNFGSAAMIACSVCCFTSVIFWLVCSSMEDGNYIAYPLDGGAEYWQPYLQQFDAFVKGQLHLDVEPSAELLQLSNPYSPDARNGINYMYDRAFFDGKYYSYFGIAPILAVYYPFYLLTGFLPMDSMVMGIFSLVTALFLPWAVIEFAKLRNSGTRPWFAAVCAVGAYFSSGVLFIQRGRAPFYYIASIAGMAFVSAFVFFLLKAYNQKKMAARIILLFLSGLSFGLAFHSRINSVVPAAVLTAVFVIIYFIISIRKKRVAPFVGEMIVLALPVAAAVGFSLYYNYIRFGDFLQFGTDYQLTLMNTSLYKAGANGFFASLYHYFIQPFVVTDKFPYINLAYLHFADYGKNVYTDSGFGLLAFPFMLALLLNPVLLKSKDISKNGKVMLAASLLSFVLTAFLNFGLGGVIFRYTADISLLAAFVSAVIIMEICLILQKNHEKSVSSAAKKTVAAVTCITAAVAVFAAMAQNGNFVEYDPDIYLALKDFVIFWN